MTDRSYGQEGKNMNDKKEMIKQIKWLVIILIIVIGIAIFVNIKNTASKELNIENDTNQEIRIDGLTEEEVDSFKEVMDIEKYEKYKQTFKDIKEENTPYYEGMTLEPKEKTEEELEKQAEELERRLQEAEKEGNWHYFTLEDGTVTNTIIYDNVDVH